MMNEILQSVWRLFDLRKFRDRVEEVLGERETTSLSEMVEMYLGARDCGAWSVTASLQARTVVEILRDEVVHIDLNRPAQPR